MRLDKSLNPKHIAIAGAILVLVGFGYARITGRADVIIMFFTFFSGHIHVSSRRSWLVGVQHKKKKK